MNNTLARRRFLRSATACIGLPFLESLGFRRFASAATKAASRPKRMIFLAMGWGVTNDTWYPDPKQTGGDWTLPEGLKPLAKFHQDITLIQNTYHKYSTEGHSGSTFWLTGANQYGMPGRSFHNATHDSLRSPSAIRAAKGGTAVASRGTGSASRSQKSPIQWPCFTNSFPTRRRPWPSGKPS